MYPKKKKLSIHHLEKEAKCWRAKYPKAKDYVNDRLKTSLSNTSPPSQNNIYLIFLVHNQTPLITEFFFYFSLILCILFNSFNFIEYNIKILNITG